MIGREIKDIEPREVFKYFQELSTIPRCSGNEKRASEYVIEFAKQLNLAWYTDDLHNVVIKKDASKGYENYPTVILQGHIDMVCEKNQATVHDFKKDPIKIIVEDDIVRADGTTLGADNGLGVSMALAVLADEKIKHPKLEVVITTNEETGMSGAEYLDKSILEGEILINLDANDEGFFVVGCAGGPAILTEIDLKREEVELGLDENLISLKVRGLIGGHSGEDIHRGRANAIKLMTRTIMEIEREVGCKIVDLKSGVQYNAIPREANALILVEKGRQKDLEYAVNKMDKVFKNEYRSTDKNISLTIEIVDNENRLAPLNLESQRKILDYLYLADNGIVRMDMEFENTVESSLSIGVAKIDNNKLHIETLTRSSLESMYFDMYYKIVSLANMVDGRISIISNCLEWEYNPNSKVKDIFEETYYEMYKEKPKSMILHAGLECGIFSKNMDRQLDIIAVGPDIRDLHTPGEYFTISSTQRFWKFLVKVLGKLK